MIWPAYRDPPGGAVDISPPALQNCGPASLPYCCRHVRAFLHPCRRLGRRRRPFPFPLSRLFLWPSPRRSQKGAFRRPRRRFPTPIRHSRRRRLSSCRLWLSARLSHSPSRRRPRSCRWRFRRRPFPRRLPPGTAAAATTTAAASLAHRLPAGGTCPWRSSRAGPTRRAT